ncbi:hypothetical protein E3A20_30080 [Planctomyces bekefii]|uniref:Uncharacterized protein n=1 Tax=Planctomyces bekefii TaxID=1653850 RepID=A0A5C6M1G7_9PLAN|nr:hypothetical protein E3A20_30080 [Planctomyces bekefii]
MWRGVEVKKEKGELGIEGEEELEMKVMKRRKEEFLKGVEEGEI